ncbi:MULTISPECIES: cold shock domain-containing protein [unclassified Pseudomonas]|uniref:cold shock domain-containing protein n=1 Tax=unclassified Pseudomonas TaxID=196821 RepID=UPI0025FA12B4|nr:MULTISPECIES: cold shock domain-containing protein [unclassified Pseudomonas]
MSSSTVLRGKVKWFNNAKGYGFIITDSRPGEDLFAHYSSIKMDGYRTLKAGQAVKFDVIQGPRGTHAIEIYVETFADSEASGIDAAAAHSQQSVRSKSKVDA